ncbi:C40 family peptidase [Phytohalomonas tamaricis]|uniref:C40 family peptidase n=1 Tax=Phytohalomonas tamaricis TaxID=2081032 RepID=UPI000D0BD97E|nr:C40 family peptidase [Phytohalomonas tamaricis]
MDSSSTHLVNVAVAGVWASPDAPRALDRPVLAAPVKMREWLDAMDDTARRELCTHKLIDTQALLGEYVRVLDEHDGWCRIVVPEQHSSKDRRGYPGWMRSAQLIPVARGKGDAHGCQHWAMVMTPYATLRSAAGEFEALTTSFLTRLPLLDELNDECEVMTPLGRGLISRDAVEFDAGSPRQRSATEIIAMGEAFLGLPYLWSGRSAFGFDCSGFVHALFKAAGYLIPRDAIDQAEQGQPVALDALAVGDLLFFERPQHDGRLRIEHVGLYCGDGQMLHSPTSGQSIEYCRLAGSQYADELCAARRYTTPPQAPQAIASRTTDHADTGVVMSPLSDHQK